MPNHPQATSARKTAATFAPRTPNEARANTGKGIPYFAPGCEFSSIGASTITLPMKDRDDRLLPVHSALDQAGRQHVGENVHRHRNPKRCEVVGSPVPLLGRGRRKIVVVERAGFDARWVERAEVVMVIVVAMLERRAALRQANHFNRLRPKLRFASVSGP